MVFLFGACLIAELVASSHLTETETEFQQGGNLPKAVQEEGKEEQGEEEDQHD